MFTAEILQKFDFDKQLRTPDLRYNPENLSYFLFTLVATCGDKPDEEIVYEG